MSLLRQPILLLSRSQGVKKLVSTMPVSSSIVTGYVPGETHLYPDLRVAELYGSRMAGRPLAGRTVARIHGEMNASAMASAASVTVSIAAEQSGICSRILRVNWVAVSVWEGRTSERSGIKSTSSKVKPSKISGVIMWRHYT